MEIQIISLVGEFCLTEQEGHKLFSVLSKALKQKEDVVLDFKGAKAFASPFFNVAIGQLLKDYKREYLRLHISFINLDPVGKETVERVIDNSDKYYSSSGNAKNIDDTISRQDDL